MKPVSLTLLMILFMSLLANSQVLNVNKELIDKTTQDFHQEGNPIEFAKTESIGGKMDFEEILKDEKGKLFVFDGEAYLREDIIVLFWGIAAQKINIETFNIAKSTWQEIYKMKLSGHAKKAFKKGYNYKK